MDQAQADAVPGRHDRLWVELRSSDRKFPVLDRHNRPSASAVMAVSAGSPPSGIYSCMRVAASKAAAPGKAADDNEGPASRIRIGCPADHRADRQSGNGSKGQEDPQIDWGGSQLPGYEQREVRIGQRGRQANECG